MSLKLYVCALLVLLLCSGCGHFLKRELEGVEAPPPASFSFLGDKYPCYLEIAPGQEALRVTCFEVDGKLHILSSRWANLPRVSGESWRDTVRRSPDVRIEIDDKIYAMRANPIDNEERRQEMLVDRGYVYAWEGITIFRFEAIR